MTRSAAIKDPLALAIDLALENVQAHGGRPFGAVLVYDGEIVATGVNEIAATCDPTTHAEMQAIQNAARERQQPRLDGHIMHASGHPCPMCVAAMYMAGIREVHYAYANEDGAAFGLSTADVYEELGITLDAVPMQMIYRPLRPAGQRDLYEAWAELCKA